MSYSQAQPLFVRNSSDISCSLFCEMLTTPNISLFCKRLAPNIIKVTANLISNSVVSMAPKNVARNKSVIAWKLYILVMGMLGNCNANIHHLAGTQKDVGVCKGVTDEVKKEMCEIVVEEESIEVSDKRKGNEVVDNFRNIFKRVVSSNATINTMFKKSTREDACQAIAKLFYNNVIPFCYGRWGLVRNEQEQEIMGEGLAQPLWRQPFCEEIDEARIPPHFREILVDPFDEIQDPHAHLQAFQTQMYISGGDDKLSCKLFPGTLRGEALQWMMNLPPRSIRVFNDLVGLFLSQFATNKSKRLEVADLFDTRQTGGESLKSYMARLNDATVRVNDYDQKFFVKAFKKGLRIWPFSDALALQKPMSMEEIRVRSEKHIEMEESRFDKRESEHLNKEGRSKSARERPPLIDGRDLYRKQGPDRRHEIPPKFTPLKEKKAHIMWEICHTRLLNFP
ncbi:hypothetical protein CR513_49966, partial [Mucuna pruriens]